MVSNSDSTRPWYTRSVLLKTPGCCRNCMVRSLGCGLAAMDQAGKLGVEGDCEDNMAAASISGGGGPKP